jgi:hypothetical protein
LLERAQSFLVNIAGFDTFNQTLTQPAQMMPLQLLLNHAHFFYRRNQRAGLCWILVHHYV